MKNLLFLLNVRSSIGKCSSRLYSSKVTNEFAMRHRAQIFEREKQSQLKEIERIEKIEVKAIDQENREHVLMMNKDLSTPYNCAMHLSELLCQRSVVAKVDGAIWDMHRPLENSCTLNFLHFNSENPIESNNAYWRSCSFLLGYLLESAFKQNFFVDLCSFTAPDIKSGSFFYDVKLNIDNWKPSKDELRCLSIAANKLFSRNLNFERLQVKPEVAAEMFKYNQLKLQQIPQIVASNQKSLEEGSTNNKITLYKVGDYVDISKGPMIASTSLIGRFEVTGLFDVKSSKYGSVQRIQGVSIPKELNLHFWTFNLLSQRASQPNAS